MKTKTSATRNLTKRTSRHCGTLRRLLSALALALVYFALSPVAQGVCQEGCDTLRFNTFLGDDALLNDTSGSANTAIGFKALFTNTSGYYNTATGWEALFFNTSGKFNTATGMLALGFNTTGNYNTANGYNALYENTTGDGNTATGVYALLGNTTGKFNTGSGFNALLLNSTGRYNTAIGFDALHNLTGSYNTAIGYNALAAAFRGSSNIALGSNAGFNLTGGDNNIDIGNGGVASESNTIRIGMVGTHTATFIAGITGATVPDGVGVIVGSDGHLGTVVSSARYKDMIKPMDKASEAILALKPVTFRYKHELDPDSIPQFGLVAEDVEKVNPDLVARDKQGKPYTVRYEAVNAMLLNEFIKARRQIDAQQKQIEALTAGLQKVSAQLELSKSAPQTVLNDQ